MTKLVFLCWLLTCFYSCSFGPIASITHLKMQQPPSIGQTVSGQNLFLGGFSGLMLKGAVLDNDKILFQTITDRGPNGYLTANGERPFLIPEFSPQIITLKANLKDLNLEVIDILKLKKPNGLPLTGLPPRRSEEGPIDVFGLMYSLDRIGIDSESLVSDDEGGYFVGEEYSPSLLHFDSDGKMNKRLTPGYELPKMYLERKPNRGFEGVAKDKNKIFGILQSPLTNDQNFARIIEFDLEIMKASAEYFYEFTKDCDKVGDIVSLHQNNQFLVIEQNGKAGNESKKYIFKITLNQNDTFVKKELLLDLSSTPFKNLDKIEGIAVIDSRRLALVNDNDFQISGPTNTATGITPLNNNPNEMLIIEFKKEFIK